MTESRDNEKAAFSAAYIFDKVLKAAFVLAVFYTISFRDYLLFHSLIEFAGAAIAVSIFLLAWNSRKFSDDGFYVFIGAAFLVSGMIMVIHALAYKGMGVIPTVGQSANPATQLWLSNQYVLAASFVAAPFFAGKKPKSWAILFVFSVYFALVVLSIFWWKNFPVAYVEGSGLTAFKTYSEYSVAFLFLLSAYLFFRKKNEFDPRFVHLFYLIAILFSASTVLFTLYVGVYGSFNMWGHLIRLGAMYPVYIGVIEFGLMKPYQFLFGSLKKREESLKKNEKMFRAVVEDQTELICRFLPDGTLTFVNDAYCRYYGKSREAILDKPYFGNVPEDVAEKDKIHLRELDQNNPVGQYEHRAVDKNGWNRWQHWTTRAIFDEKNRLVEFQSVGRDITQQKYIQEALVRSEEKYRSLVDNSLVGVYSADLEGNYIYVNEAMAKMFEFESAEEMIRESAKIRYEKAQDRENFLKQLKEKGRITNYELTGVTKKGKRIHVLSNATWSQNRISGMILNITKRKQDERALLEAKEEWEKTFDSVPDLIAILDTEHKIVRVNKAMAERLGTSSGKCIGLNCYQCVHNTDGPIANCPHSLTLADGKEHIAVVEEKNLKGTFLVSTTPFFGKDGKIAGSVHVARDITEQKKVEKAKDEFISLASHQLRTPLSSIALSSELLLRGVAGEMDPLQKQYMKEIFKATKRMTLLINNLLNVSRVEMGNFQIQSGPLDISTAVREILEGLSPLAAEKNLKIKKNIGRDIPPISFDANSFGIIFENLLSNAIRYTPAGGNISIDLKNEKTGVLLAVSDTGCGIPAGQKENIFKKSFRAENAKEMSTTGAGLGLYMARIVTERGGAKMWFESKEGEGTTFFVLFKK